MKLTAIYDRQAVTARSESDADWTIKTMPSRTLKVKGTVVEVLAVARAAISWGAQSWIAQQERTGT